MVSDHQPNSLLDQRFFTPKQLAERLDVKQDTVLDWINSGELSASNIASKGSKRPRWRIAETDVEAFLIRRKTVPPAKRSQRRKRQSDSVIQFYK